MEAQRSQPQTSFFLRLLVVPSCLGFALLFLSIFVLVTSGPGISRGQRQPQATKRSAEMRSMWAGG